MKVHTDEATAYRGLAHRHAVTHSVGQYVHGHIHTNGMASFWSMLKRAHKGTFHKLSPQHLQRYVNEFAARHNVGDLDTIDQMVSLTLGLLDKSLPYKKLVKPNRFSPVARHRGNRQ